MITLQEYFGWQLEATIPVLDENKPGKVDALKQTSLGNVVFEWETGNISTSHRALNKIALGMLNGAIFGGALALPTRRLDPYLTDRIGNYEELQPYFPVWRELPIDYGLMLVIAIEHDAIDPNTPLIGKGTDGRALV
ncbi:MAG: restriction endonuclease [Chloroflexi bacterium AL-W]|nr:restriction endonuclease [Chloroflexi bacterium AL-N1]NOK66220.1 restriction endonuclease [Chloroflexi bacterium AL-N10]NOK73101.1 restriction endonuclease [Chloroflexi bacterium AL-N5]NOK79998.1 restriction endonuclease [Chloroflexi bacterium AL-W]NOK88146.1 restriction endonuclease [Chloroflexi bacterium AL-N15]